MAIASTTTGLLLLSVTIMISLTDGKAVYEDNWYDRMQVDPGYYSDASGLESSGKPDQGDIYDRMQVDPGYVSDDMVLKSLEKPGKGCRGKPADVYFLLDASDEVGEKGFQRSLQYVSDVIPTFAEDRTRIGVITYSGDVYFMIRLGQYQDQAKLQAAVMKIPFQGGQPDTGNALRYLRRKAFLRGVAKREVAHIAIVVTNGYSRNTKDVVREAQLVHKSGIYMYAVYPSEQADPQELSTIASEPVENFLFSMSTFNILSSTAVLLGSELCEIQVDPTDASKARVCNTKRPADIVFAVDYATIGVKKAKKIMRFVKEASRVLDIGSDRVHVGVVTNDCPKELDIDLGDHYTSDGLLRDMESIVMPSQSDLLKKVRRRSFSRFYGARVDVQQTLVMFVDDKLDNPTRVIQEATRTKGRKIQIIVVAIGSRLNMGNLARVATGADSIVKIRNLDDLMPARDDIFRLVCRGL